MASLNDAQPPEDYREWMDAWGVANLALVPNEDSPDRTNMLVVTLDEDRYPFLATLTVFGGTNRLGSVLAYVELKLAAETAQ